VAEREGQGFYIGPAAFDMFNRHLRDIKKRVG
jgi:hypothetical protein